MSFGEQRRLELARAIASKPKLILLDEPAAGMNSDEVADLRQKNLGSKKTRPYCFVGRACNGACNERRRQNCCAQFWKKNCRGQS